MRVNTSATVPFNPLTSTLALLSLTLTRGVRNKIWKHDFNIKTKERSKETFRKQKKKKVKEEISHLF